MKSKIPVRPAPWKFIGYHTDFGGNCTQSVISLLSPNWSGSGSSPCPERIVVTYSSLLGTRGHLGKVVIRELWCPSEARLLISLLEIGAICLDLNAFIPSIKGWLALVPMGNTSTSSQAGWSGILCPLLGGFAFWSWLMHKGIFLRLNHLARSLNARGEELNTRYLAHHKR